MLILQKAHKMQNTGFAVVKFKIEKYKLFINKIYLIKIFLNITLSELKIQ